MSEIWHYKMKRDDVNLYFRGDIHLGTKQSDIDAWQLSTEVVLNDPIAFDFGMGDFVDAIVSKDRRYDPFNRDTQFESIDDAFSFFEDHYKALQDKSGGLLVGNHEWKLIQYSEMNEIRKICRRLKIPYLGFSALVNMEFPNGKKLSGFISHGAGGGRSPGAKTNRLDEIKGKFPGVDFAVYGHTHDIIIRPSPVLEMNGTKLGSRIMHLAYSGSFLRNYVPGTLGYGERALYDPLPVGFVYLEIRDGVIEEGFRYTVIH